MTFYRTLKDGLMAGNNNKKYKISYLLLNIE